MKTSILLLSILFQSSFASAAQPVTLNMDLTLNGETSHPRVTVNAGENATVFHKSKTGESYEISILPTATTLNGKTAMDMQFTISSLDQNGNKKLISAPRTIQLTGTEWKMTETAKNDSITLKIRPVF